MKPSHPTLVLSAVAAASLVCGSAGAAPAKPTAKSAVRSSPKLPTTKTKPAPETPSGTLKLPYDEFNVALLAWDGSRMITVSGKNGVASAPAGNYWLTSWNVQQKDANGRMWRAEGGPTGQPQLIIRVGAGTTSEFRVATPLHVALTVEQVDAEFCFILRFRGTVGDHCSRVFVDGEQPPVPRLKIVDADGALVDTLELKWGCGFLCRKIWQAPQDVKWPLKAIAEVDFGPFPITGDPVELNREPAVATPAAP